MHSSSNNSATSTSSTALDVGPFRLLEPLASGGMGVVWSATPRDGSGLPDVAIKLLRADRATDESQLEGFLRETQITASLCHPNIVQTLDSGVLPPGDWPEPLAAGCPWLAMKQAPGGTLVDIAGRLPWSDARRMLLELLDALAYVHDAGLVHLDIKPGNVLIGADGESILADFGLARPISATGNQSAQNWGTAAYMAPEQLAEEPERVGPATDLYAFGCVAWSLLSGRPPFGRAPEEAAVQHLYSPVPNLASSHPVPREIEVWLRRLLAKAPNERFEDARAAAIALLALGDAPLDSAGGRGDRRHVGGEPTTRKLQGPLPPLRPASEPRKRVLR